jgi:hypothetical protein
MVSSGEFSALVVEQILKQQAEDLTDQYAEIALFSEPPC